MTPEIFAEIEKNSKEKIVVSIVEYKGYKFVDSRVLFKDNAGTWHPTKKGLSLSGKNIDGVIAGLKAASEKLKVS